jgi:hypothetical protein
VLGFADRCLATRPRYPVIAGANISKKTNNKTQISNSKKQKTNLQSQIPKSKKQGIINKE